MTSPNPNPPPGGNGSFIQNLEQGLGSIFSPTQGVLAPGQLNNSGQVTDQSTGQPAQNGLPQLGGAIGNLITGGLGLKINMLNIVLNSIFYGVVATVGVWVMLRGLNLIVSEVPGASGAGSYLTSTFTGPVKSAAGKASALVGKLPL